VHFINEASDQLGFFFSQNDNLHATTSDTIVFYKFAWVHNSFSHWRLTQLEEEMFASKIRQSQNFAYFGGKQDKRRQR